MHWNVFVALKPVWTSSILFDAKRGPLNTSLSCLISCLMSAPALDNQSTLRERCSFQQCCICRNHAARLLVNMSIHSWFVYLFNVILTLLCCRLCSG